MVESHLYNRSITIKFELLVGKIIINSITQSELVLFLLLKYENPKKHRRHPGVNDLGVNGEIAHFLVLPGYLK